MTDVIFSPLHLYFNKTFNFWTFWITNNLQNQNCTKRNMEQPNNSLSTDALPMQPRQPDGPEVVSAVQIPQTCIDSNEATETTTIEDFEEIPEPHPDWQFNLFLDQIADGLTGEEFDKLKHLFRGHGGIGESTLKEMKTVRDLFSIIRTRRLLGRENLVYLHSMLHRIGRMDLINVGVEYAKTVGNVIHCYPASPYPENGYRYVKFHVEGRNFRSCTRGYIQNLRSIIANILFIPAEFVVIAGVEPSSSLLITLMIPEAFVAILESLLENKTCSTDMKELGIDFVEIDKVYNVGDELCTGISENDQQKKFANLYQQLEMKSRDLEVSETERLRLSGQLERERSKVATLEEQRSEDKLIIMTLKGSTADSPESQGPNEPSTQTVIEEFESALKTISRHDKTDVQTLISANTWVVAKRLTERFSIRQRQIELSLEELQSQLFPLKFELQKLRFFSEIDIDEMDRMLLEFYERLTQSIPKEVSVTVVFDEELLRILKKISRSLRAREREKLIKKYNWAKDDKLKEAIDLDQTLVLSCILIKEIEQTKTLVDMEKYITRCLTDVGRTDLVKKFQDLLRGKTQSETNQKRKRNASRRQRSGSLSRTTENEKKGLQEEEIQVINKIAEQVQHIHDSLTINRKNLTQQVGIMNEWELSCFPPPYSRYSFI